MRRLTIASIVAVNLVLAAAAPLLWFGLGHDARSAVKPVAPPVVTEEDRVVGVIAKASPAVVSILAQQELAEDTFIVGANGVGELKRKGELEELGRGTGFIVSANGMIVTNRHLAGDRKAKYTVFLQDETRYDAKILDIDPLNDLTLIKIEAKNLPKLELEKDDSYRIGQTVIAIGNALGRYANTATRGILSGVNRSLEAVNERTGVKEVLEDIMQTDAPINAGNSGGPLLNLDGKVIGINTAIEKGAQSLGFAIPVSEIRKVIDSYGKYASIARPRLGVRYFPITPELVLSENLIHQDGALIKSAPGVPAVILGSPAQLAGLQPGDIILSINGQKIEGKKTVRRIIQALNVGDRIKLMIARGAETFEASLTLDGHAPVGF
jgi:serine protease Do